MNDEENARVKRRKLITLALTAFMDYLP